MPGIDLVTLRIASTLQEPGYQALPASKRIGYGRVCGAFSHKMAANLAGLGWIGKICLAYHSWQGSPGPVEERPCQCPAAANRNTDGTAVRILHSLRGYLSCKGLHPGPVFEEDSLEARFDVTACERHFIKYTTDNRVPVCGLCVYTYPHGRSKREDRKRVTGQ